MYVPCMYLLCCIKIIETIGDEACTSISNVFYASTLYFGKNSSIVVYCLLTDETVILG